MTDAGPLAALGWLVFLLGAGMMLIAVLPRKGQVRSPARRLAGALSGLVFVLLAGIVIIPGISSGTQKALFVSAIVAGALSWYIGLHARRVDRVVR